MSKESISLFVIGSIPRMPYSVLAATFWENARELGEVPNRNNKIAKRVH